MAKVIYAVGDAATGNSDSAQLASYIAAQKPDAFFFLGDVYESGTASEFAANYKPSWGQLDPVCYPIPGNHDWANYHGGFLPYFQGRNLGFTDDRSWYATSFGDWIILMLNSEAAMTPESPQYLWAQSMVNPPDIQENPRKRIACWHRPRYCSGSHGDAQDTDPLWQLLAPHCAVIIGGHAHNMQQFKPDATGCRQLVSGAGGRGLYAEVADDARLEWGESDGNGVVRLELGDKLGIRWVGQNGNTLHESEVAL